MAVDGSIKMILLDNIILLDGNGLIATEMDCQKAITLTLGGKLLTNTTSPDGYTVNSDGEWIVDGVVQTQSSPDPNSGYLTFYDTAQTALYHSIDDGVTKNARGYWVLRK